MSWSWRYENGVGALVARPSLPRHDFPTQADAESWLGENWRDLVDGGVEAVSLLEGESVVYGMSLQSPD